MNPSLGKTRPLAHKMTTPNAGQAVLLTQDFPVMSFDQIFEKILEGVYESFPALIMPETAELILELNTHNRALKESLIADYADQLRLGLWRPRNGTTISFNKEGMLDDGQHRLSACIRAGIPLASIFVVGNDEDAKPTIDHGAKRTDSDHLRIAGEKHTSMLGAALRMVWRWEQDLLSRRQTKPHSMELDSILQRHPDLRASAAWAVSVHRKRCCRLGTPALICFLHYVFNRKHPDLVEAFFSAVETGANLPENSPMLQLINRMNATHRAKGARDPLEVMALWIKAWNFHVSGRGCRVLFWRSTGEQPEAFPAIQ